MLLDRLAERSYVFAPNTDRVDYHKVAHIIVSFYQETARIWELVC